MNDLCRWVPRGAMSAATERSSSTRRHWNDENRLNRVLSPFYGQQKNIEAAGPGVGFRVPAQRRFFRRGLRRNGSGLLPLAPHPPPCKTGFLCWRCGCREILAASFSGYFFNNQLFFTS